MQWVEGNSVCRNNTHLYNTCSITNKLKIYLAVKSNVYILNYFLKKRNKSKKKSLHTKKGNKNPKTPKKSGLQALHYLVCHCYNHTGADREGHTF